MLEIGDRVRYNGVNSEVGTIIKITNRNDCCGNVCLVKYDNSTIWYKITDLILIEKGPGMDFKVGDKVKHVGYSNSEPLEIVKIGESGYYLCEYSSGIRSFHTGEFLDLVSPILIDRDKLIAELTNTYPNLDTSWIVRIIMRQDAISK